MTAFFEALMGVGKMKRQAVFVVVLTKKYGVRNKQLIQIIENILSGLGLKGCGVNLMLISDQRMVAMNARVFKRRRSTDVISFPWHNTIGDSALKGRCPQGLFLGDVAISLDRAYFRAASFGNSFNEECMTYVIHGILHLVGFDDTTPPKKRIMFAKQKQVMDQLRKKGLLKKPTVVK